MATPADEGCLDVEGSNAIRHVVALYVDDRLSADASAIAVLSAYTCLYESTWEELSLLLGQRGTRLVFERAIELQLSQRPALGLVEMSDAGPVLSRLLPVEAGGAASPRGDLAGLFTAICDLLCQMIGADLVASILQRIAADAKRRR